VHGRRPCSTPLCGRATKGALTREVGFEPAVNLRAATAPRLRSSTYAAGPQLIGRTLRVSWRAGADGPFARPQAGKSGQNNRKQRTDAKRAACSHFAYSPAPSLVESLFQLNSVLFRLALRLDQPIPNPMTKRCSGGNLL
jgi:hypothetical protein